MTPTLFSGTDAKDEYTFMQAPGAREKLAHHRKTFITEEDFIWMSQNNVQTIRIPFGYWIFDGDDPYMAGIEYVDWAMEMAEKYKLQAIVDLHGLKGAQNRFDHSGRVGKPQWFKYAAYRKETIATLERLAERYKHNPYFWGLQIINEPRIGVFHFKLRSFYRQAARRLSQILLPHTRIIFSDGFTPRLMSGVLRNIQHPVVMDVHIYHMTKFVSWIFTIERYYKSIQKHKRLFRRLSKEQPIIIGEWNGVMRQRTLDTIPVSEHEALVRKHCEIQQKAFSETEGWYYWNYKTEKRGVWHFRSQVEDGVIKLS